MNRRITRRNILRGAGGMALALPLLPSLAPKSARAGGFTGPRRFVAIRTGHGGCWESNFFPQLAPSESMSYAGHEIRRAELSSTTEGDMAVLSGALRAPSDVLTTAMVERINVIRGIDSMQHVGHNAGAFLGNPHATLDGETQAVLTPRPTIDQVLAWSPSFYGDLSTTLERSLHVGEEISFGWSSPKSASGEVQGIQTMYNPLEMFNLIFIPDDRDDTMPRPLIVDSVLAEYRSLREGDRRLSAADRQRLDDHMERIDELQRKLEVVVDCGTATPPPWPENAYPWHPDYQGDIGLNTAFWQAFNEVVAVAFACDTSRVAVFALGDQSSFSPYIGDWHQDVAHRAEAPDAIAGSDTAQAVLRDSYQGIFEHVFLDLVRRLDVEEGLGGTILDNSLVMWGQESGPMTHDCTNMPLVTAGSLGGALRTGQSLDYRNLGSPLVDPWGTALAPNGETIYSGLANNQLLGTVLEAAGLPRSEFEDAGAGGYGAPVPTENRAQFYPSAVRDRMGEPLPWLMA